MPSKASHLPGKTSALLVIGLIGAFVAVQAPSASAAGETVNIYLTTTSGTDGRTVTRGLQQQTPIAFGPAGGSASHTITVDENTKYQQFTGGGASITDTTATLFRGGAISATTRDAVMTKLFSPTAGIGLSFTRNPIGASDLSRPGNVSLDDTCCDLNDFNTNGYDANVQALTVQAKSLNPALSVMAVPWSSPGWMKDNGRMDQMGWLKFEDYGLYAQYLTKYVQAYANAGVHIDYLSVQNEPNCCHADNPVDQTYPGMNWNASGLTEFTKNYVYPAFHAAGLTTKVLVHDWNYGDYASTGQQILADAALRNDSLFGGIAWHGYSGSPSLGSDVHTTYPSVAQFETEHSGGDWIGNQQNEDMSNIVDYTRNWAKSVDKWSLAVDQSKGPHNGGCGTCTGFVTVQNGGARAGQVDYTIEYYTMGHLTKFVKPGAYRIASTADSTVQNVAWLNPDGSKALIAHNGTASAQSMRVNWGSQSFTYSLPAHTSATFTWAGTSAPPASGTGAITGLAGKCLDVAAANSADGTAVQLYTCNGSAAQQWTRSSNGTLTALGKCLDVSAASTADGAKVQIYTCNGTAAQQWTVTAANDIVNTGANKCLDVKGNVSTDATPTQIWTCTGASNQKWTAPAL